MSKTYRGEERRKRKGERRREPEDWENPERYVRRVEQPAVITPEWAIERMKRHVDYKLEQLISNGELLVRDKEDYVWIVNARIARSLDYFDVENRKGRSASAVHYLNIVVDNEISHIRRSLIHQQRLRIMGAVMLLPESVAADYHYVDASAMSDGCRSVKELELKLDVNTLRGLMLPNEVEIFDQLLEGYTQEEISLRQGLSRWLVMKAIRAIRKKARTCGFEPPSEVRRGRIEERWKKSLQNSAPSVVDDSKGTNCVPETKGNEHG